MNLDLCLMAYMFGENLNKIFEEEEKRFSNEGSKVKFSRKLKENNDACIQQWQQQRHHRIMFLQNYSKEVSIFPKVNLLHNDGTQTVGYIIDYANDTLNAEVTDDNDNVLAIDVPAPKWNNELNDYECEDRFTSNGYKLTLFEPIVMRFKRNNCVSNFWIISNRCAKCIKFNEPGVLTFDLSYVS